MGWVVDCRYRRFLKETKMFFFGELGMGMVWGALVVAELGEKEERRQVVRAKGALFLNSLPQTPIHLSSLALVLSLSLSL